MATTSYLNLTLLEGPSVVDYNSLNSWVQTIDRLGVEYVVKKGTKGEYWYRIWSSGRAECGIDNEKYYDSLRVDYTNVWPPLRTPQRALTDFGNYPVQFTRRPSVTINLNYCYPESSWIVVQKAQSGSQTAPSYILAGCYSSSQSYDAYLSSVQMSIFCVGPATNVVS